MPSPNNLRIIYNNLIDLPTTVLTANSQGGTWPTSPLKVDTKSVVWRSQSINKASIIVDWGTTPQSVDGLVFAFTNVISSSSTIRIRAYNSAPTITDNNIVGVNSLYDTGDQPCCPWSNLDLPSWGTNPVGSSNYSYGGGTYCRLWLNSVQRAITSRYLGIELIDPTSSRTNLEISRMIAGQYWSPTYNTGYGIESAIKDLSEHLRTEGGDLVTRRGPRVRTLNFDLQWLASVDRKELTRLFLGNGISKPLFASIFPDSTGTDEDYQREGIHQIYGKFMAIPGVSYTNYEIYSTRMELEEV